MSFKQFNIFVLLLFIGQNHPGVTVTSPCEEEKEDEGITFTAKSFSLGMY